MVRTPVLFLACLAVAAQANWIHETSNSPSEENEECHREGSRVWLCKEDKKCTSLRAVLMSGASVKTCFWKNARTHIVCCPPDRPVDYSATSISEKKCTEYESLVCKDKGNQNHLISKRFYRAYDEKEKTEEFQKRTKRQFFEAAAIGGKNAKPKEYPHMALIGYGKESSISWQCGGSLISERYVLSAAHCSETSYGPARWARLGDLDIKSDTDDAQPQQFEIVEHHVHADYRPPTFYNDIVLFRLDRPAWFDEYVRPACLYSSLEDPPGLGVATGWGRNETNGPRSSSLVKVILKFIPTDECKKNVGVLQKELPDGLNSKTMLCAGEPGKDTCQGDSGGPLVLQGFRIGHCLASQVGVTSFGPKNCGETHITGTYVRVAHFLPWIESVVWPEE